MKNLILIITLITGLFTLPATDDCSSSLFGTSWTVVTGSFTVSSGRCIASTPSSFNEAKWTADSFNNDHYIQANLFSDTIGSPALCVRFTGIFHDETDGYCLFRIATSNIGQLYRIDNGAGTQLGTDYGTISDSTVVKLQAISSTLDVIYDTVSQGTRSDATYSNGTVAIRLFSQTGAWDNFLMDNVAAASTSKGLLLMGVGNDRNFINYAAKPAGTRESYCNFFLNNCSWRRLINEQLRIREK